MVEITDLITMVMPWKTEAVIVVVGALVTVIIKFRSDRREDIKLKQSDRQITQGDRKLEEDERRSYYNMMREDALTKDEWMERALAAEGALGWAQQSQAAAEQERTALVQANTRLLKETIRLREERDESVRQFYDAVESLLFVEDHPDKASKVIDRVLVSRHKRRNSDSMVNIPLPPGLAEATGDVEEEDP